MRVTFDMELIEEPFFEDETRDAALQASNLPGHAELMKAFDGAMLLPKGARGSGVELPIEAASDVALVAFAKECAGYVGQFRTLGCPIASAFAHLVEALAMTELRHREYLANLDA